MRAHYYASRPSQCSVGNTAAEALTPASRAVSGTFLFIPGGISMVASHAPLIAPIMF